MLFSESIKTALDSIKSNATRSFLTALAIIIGIASVIAMLSIGAGAQQALDDEINALGDRVVRGKIKAAIVKAKRAAK